MPSASTPQHTPSHSFGRSKTVIIMAAMIAVMMTISVSNLGQDLRTKYLGRRRHTLKSKEDVNKVMSIDLKNSDWLLHWSMPQYQSVFDMNKWHSVETVKALSVEDFLAHGVLLEDAEFIELLLQLRSMQNQAPIHAARPSVQSNESLVESATQPSTAATISPPSPPSALPPSLEPSSSISTPDAALQPADVTPSSDKSTGVEEGVAERAVDSSEDASVDPVPAGGDSLSDPEADKEVPPSTAAADTEVPPSTAAAGSSLDDGASSSAGPVSAHLVGTQQETVSTDAPAPEPVPEKQTLTWARRGGRHVISLDNGLKEGTCLNFQITYHNKGKFLIELRGSTSRDNPRCTFGEDLIHLHVRWAHTIYPFAVASKGIEKYQLWDAEVHFDELFANQPGLRQYKICIENSAFKMYVDDTAVPKIMPRWDPSDISCIAVDNSVDVTPLEVSNMPSSRSYNPLFSKVPSTPAPVTKIEHAFFINLAHRDDRKEKMEQQLSAAGIPFQRMEAFNTKEEASRDPSIIAGCWDASSGAKTCSGQIGCQRSHMKILDHAIAQQWTHVAVFEDDFVWQPWVDQSKVMDIVSRTMAQFPDWDVIALSLNIMAEKHVGQLDIDCRPGQRCVVTKIVDAQTTGAYVIRDTAMKAVRYRFSDDYCSLRDNYGIAIDTCWKGLQQTYNFYAFEPQMATQQSGFSDIEGTHVSYGLSR